MVVNEDQAEIVRYIFKEYLNGVGMTVSESWSDEVRWYNQYNVPLKFAQDPNTVRDVLGAYMPVPTGTEDIEPVEEPEPVPESNGSPNL